MEFMLAGITTGNIGILPLVTVSRAHNGHRPCGDRLPNRVAGSRVRSLSARLSSSSFSSSSPYFSYSTPGSMCGALVLADKRRRWHCVSTSAALNERSGDDGGFSGDSGGDGSAAVDLKVEVEAGASKNSSDFIILDVEGMMCGGCTSSVTKILEGQPQVSSASVDLTMKTATVWPVAEVKAAPNWQKELGEALAKHLSDCGFKSSHRAIEKDT